MRKTHNGIKYKFFWSGIFSNWHPSEFIIDGITFNSGEQWMMVQKAKTFNDVISIDKILSETNPKIQKQLGRYVKNFDADIWDEVKYGLVKIGLREKFLQNEDMLKYLLEYDGYQMVEASPYDRIWGIGFLDKDAIGNINDWGENLLGKILTELSIELR